MTTVLALEVADPIAVGVLIANGVLALVALAQLFVFVRSEGRRAQPVAVAHMQAPRNSENRFQAVIENLGSGAAFNVRVGVKLDGIEYPLGAGGGNRYTVGAGVREPPHGGLCLQVPPWPYALSLRGPDVDARAVFYARYEDAIGRSWESLNPVDPLAGFVIQRARLRRLREWHQARLRARIETAAVRRLDEEGRGEPLTWQQRLRRWLEGRTFRLLP